MNELAVDVKNLTVKFDAFYAVNEISFSVARGEIFGFLGANGAGKTTTIRVLCGLLTPTSGSVTVANFDLKHAEFKIKSKVGYMSQKFTLYNDLTVAENLDFIAALRKLDRGKYVRRREDLFKLIDFNRDLNTLVDDLPGGIKQQVSLAAAMLHDPDIIFLDEPTAGVSPEARARFWELINELAKSGKTVFVTTHYMDEAEQCGRIALMREGRIVALDTPDNLKASAFDSPMYEFNPIVPISYDELVTLQNNTCFSYFEPYGLRFHAVFKHGLLATEQAQFANKYKIREIKPSLEDVFIHMVEAKQI